MGVKKTYTAAQVLKMIGASEGNIVRDGRIRQADHDEPGAHAMGRHLVSAGTIKGKPSGPQAGATFVANRYINSPQLTSSAWYQKGDMAIKLTEALNSPLGQEALAVMDSLGLSRIAVHYINQNVMKHKDGAFNPSHMSVDYTVTPDRQEKYSKDIVHPETGAFIKTISKSKTIKGSTTPNVGRRDIVGIHLVLDRHDGHILHLQTLYPSFEPLENQFEYQVGQVAWTVTQDGNEFKKSFSCR